jgi:hypothetical protein
MTRLEEVSALSLQFQNTTALEILIRRGPASKSEGTKYQESKKVSEMIMIASKN